MPRLGKTYDIEIDVTSRPKAKYSTDEYYELGLSGPEPGKKNFMDRLLGR